ncbi:MAG: histidinol-phosphatase [Meiothermus sp.]
MNRKELAGMLEYAADLMEVLGEGDFRVGAYRKAARNIEKLERDLDELAANGFRGVFGVGPSLAPVLTEIVQTGEFPYLGELESQIPPGVLELFRVQGLGPKRIRALWDNGMDSLEEVIRHAEEGKIRALPGFGAKSEAGILEAARFALANLRRVLLPVGIAAGRLLLKDLANAGIQAELAGSVRRGLETVGNLDLVAVGSPEQVAVAIGEHAEKTLLDRVQGQVEGLSLRIFCATPENFGTVLFQATGSGEWLSAKGYELSAQPTEEAVFAAANAAYVPPHWREPEHIGLPAPDDGLRPEQLRGLIHIHTTYSDATGTIREMAEAAIAAGYEYMVLSDHSQTAAYAGGLTAEDLERQWAEVDALNAELKPFRILKGIESDILTDGSLDYPDEVLARFDMIIGSLHSGFNLSRDDQTARFLRVLENPYLTILGHPTGRLLLRRRGVDADWERILEHASRYGKIVEFNCNPYRLDLDWRLVLRWRDRLNFSLGPDCHSVNGLADIGYGLLYAHKCGLRPEQVANTWTAEQLMEVSHALRP